MKLINDEGGVRTHSQSFSGKCFGTTVKARSLGFCFVPMIKYSDKKLRDVEFILVHNPTYSPSQWGNQGIWSLKQLVPIIPKSEVESNEYGQASIQLSLSTLTESGIP